MEPRLSYVIGRLDHVLRRRIAELVEPHGLTVSQYTALSVMRSRPGLSNAQLARRALITPQSMNEVLAQLTALKLIRRHPDPNHGRAIRTDLTPRGERVLMARATERLMPSRRICWRACTSRRIGAVSTSSWSAVCAGSGAGLMSERIRAEVVRLPDSSQGR